MFLGMGAAAWPVWRWYVLRMTDGSDEPWGVLALVALMTLRLRDGWPPLHERDFVWPTVIMVVYIVSFPFAHPLIRAVLIAAALGILVLRSRGSAGLWGLLALSLPLVATLQFYVGYPLRLLAASASTSMLQGLGFRVVQDGTLLRWSGESILVDAPCSGIQMLWFGTFLAFLLAAWQRLSAGRTVVCSAAAVMLIIGANVIRATALFLKEAGIIPLPEWTHAAIGAFAFGLGAWSTSSLIQKLQPKPCVP
jgi:exosortase/archaeosortase family protein